MNEELVKNIVCDMMTVMGATLKMDILINKDQNYDDYINLILTILSSLTGSVLMNLKENAEFFNIHKAILVLTAALNESFTDKQEAESAK